MNPPCAFCKKTVYPTEKFNCLDKIWHKGCFKCTECGLKLTMNTYKGYNKNPFCKAHYPHLTATQVATTVEGQRLKQQSKQQSQVEYHKDFNQAKGFKTSIADDPETIRNMKVSANQSQANYHGHARQKADQELRRPAGDDQTEPGRGGYQQQPRQQRPPMGHSYQPQQPPPQQPPPQAAPPQPTYQPDPEPEPVPQPDYDPPAQAPPSGGDSNLINFKALYDYSAADDDEVSFVDGDMFKGTIVDEGWLEGTVLSTGQYGMAPRNYFEEV